MSREKQRREEESRGEDGRAQTTSDEQIARLIREHAPDARLDYLQHFASLFDEEGKVYAACVYAIEKPRRDEIRNRGGFIFAILQSIESAGGYDAWVNRFAATPEPPTRAAA